VDGVENVLCVHAFSLSLEKYNLSVKIVSQTNDLLLEKIYKVLGKYELFHINVEIQKEQNALTKCSCFGQTI
jgi:hypothetical protein